MFMIMCVVMRPTFFLIPFQRFFLQKDIIAESYAQTKAHKRFITETVKKERYVYVKANHFCLIAITFSTTEHKSYHIQVTSAASFLSSFTSLRAESAHCRAAVSALSQVTRSARHLQKQTRELKFRGVSPGIVSIGSLSALSEGGARGGQGNTKLNR